MQADLTGFSRDKTERGEMDAIVRACVHCGFCNATCPTYQLLGDELDGPRGRIYLMKQALEGGPVSRLTQTHLDRCLNCRSCETACPSGVRYGRLLDLGRKWVDRKVGRSAADLLMRALMTTVLPYRRRFNVLLTAARWLSPLLPQAVKTKIPPKPALTTAWPGVIHARKMLILAGCVQPSLAPAIDQAAARVLDKLGISLVPVQDSGCCGALPYHLSEHDSALALARKNIDACLAHLDQGAEAIVMTASGCGVMIKDYGTLLKHDPEYAGKAARISAAARDIGEVLAGEDLTVFNAKPKRIAFQSPCTLQHGQKLGGVVESILRKTGYQLTAVADDHLCCGSAGVYSILQPDLSGRLLSNKLQALQADQPELIATANIGCLAHLQSASSVTVVHWLELLL